MILIKSLLTEVFYEYFKLKYVHLNEGDKVCKCDSCLKLMIQAHLHVDFFIIFFTKHVSLKQFYLYMNLLQSNT